MTDLNKLREPFPKQLIKHTPQGQDYVPIAEVVARMNAVVGVGKWRVEVLRTEPWGQVETTKGPAPAHIIALVRVHVFDGEQWTWADGMGGQDVGFFNSKADKWASDKKYKKVSGPEPEWRPSDRVSPGPLNLGDAYKGACSDATKKALQQFGVALELARDDRAIELEQREESGGRQSDTHSGTRRQGGATSPPAPASSSLMDETQKLIDTVKQSDARTKNLKAWWSEQDFPALKSMKESELHAVMDYCEFLLGEVAA